ncbi:hypothetical protein VM98_37170, partial [Streptomyces rubellomurinus subsp. indigoferus]
MTWPRGWSGSAPGSPGPPAVHQRGSSAPRDAPSGKVNLWLADAVPGPLALLAVDGLQGGGVPGQDGGIEDLASWLVAHRRPAGGWPMTVRV